MADQALLRRMREWVGRTGEPQVAGDAVDQPRVRRWVDAIDDANPCYVDAGFAARSVHGRMVAPPALLALWAQAGQPDGPPARVLSLLEEAGFASAVAVNCELDIVRYVHTGEVLQRAQALSAVSEERESTLGVGHFVTTRDRYTTTSGDHVGDVVVRLFAFTPGTGRLAPAGPDPDPAQRPRPGINRDNQFFWDGARQHELRIQSCSSCGERYFPPTPRCWRCGSFDMGHVVASGRARLYSWAAPHHPQAAGFRYPVVVGLVELEEGTRLVTEIVSCQRRFLAIGMPLEVCWLDSHPALLEGATDSRGAITLPQFRPARPPRREDTLTADVLAAGEELPLFVVPSDHDLDVPTSLGFCQRWISDWAGPEVLFDNLRVRFAAPSHAGRTLTLAGQVTTVDAGTGRTAVEFVGFDELGDHLAGTAEVTMPPDRSGR
jgi:uncharacterized OB-fold protein/acyl dehydratase